MRNLKIESLPIKGWVDKDILMLHACFQLLQDFVDGEKDFNHLCTETHRAFIKEVKELYMWWQTRKGVLIENHDKDDEMLLRLLVIRQSLWT